MAQLFVDVSGSGRQPRRRQSEYSLLDLVLPQNSRNHAQTVASRSYEVGVAEVRILISRLELACADLHIDNVRAKSKTEQHQ